MQGEGEREKSSPTTPHSFTICLWTAFMNSLLGGVRMYRTETGGGWRRLAAVGREWHVQPIEAPPQIHKGRHVQWQQKEQMNTIDLRNPNRCTHR